MILLSPRVIFFVYQFSRVKIMVNFDNDGDVGLYRGCGIETDGDGDGDGAIDEYGDFRDHDQDHGQVIRVKILVHL